MAQYTAYANYVVYFSDPAEYSFAVSIAGGNVVNMSPSTAASLFGLVDGVHYSTGGALNPVKGMYGFIPNPSGPGIEINHPAPSGVFLKFTDDSVLVPGQVDSFSGIAGPDLFLVFTANIVRVGGTGSLDKPSRAPMPQRRWITGFEVDFSGEGGASGGANQRSRESSRTLDGVGWGLSNANNVNFLRNLNEYGSVAGNLWESWERFYVRVRTTGGADIDIWKSVGLPSPNAGIRIKIKTDLTLDIFNVSAAAVETLLGNGGLLVEDEWSRIDIIVQYNNIGRGNTDGRIRVWQNGTALIDDLVLPGELGIGVANQTHSGSLIGTQTAGPTTWELDFDDWHNAAIPNISGVETLNSVDWVLGTHVKRLFVNGGTNPGWSQNIQNANQMPNPENSALISTSTTALATIEGITELGVVPYPIGTIMSTNAFLISCYTRLLSGAVAGRLGYRFAGGASVLATITEGTVAQYNSVLYRGSGVDILVDPTTIVPFNVMYEKANNTVNTEMYALQGEVEFVGVWGLEDDPQTIPLPRISITHNAWYPTVANAFLGPSSDGPVVAEGGTYVGNGTAQTIIIDLPAHMIWIRPVGGVSFGGKWWGAGLGGHAGANGGVKGPNVVRADYDATTNQSSFTVLGNSLEVNQSGITYQYIVFSDPGFNFCLCGSFLHSSGVASAVNNLFDSDFLPEAAWFQPDRLDNDGNTRLMYKGPGIPSNDVRIVSGTQITTGASLATGQITSLSGMHGQSDNNQISFAAFRSTDPCGDIMLQIFEYTGDGTGNRVIPFPDTTGRFPLLVNIQRNGSSQMCTRDPSDAGANSRTVSNNANIANAIIAASNPDEIEVGSFLNAIGEVYSVFIILGDTAGFNNGSFFPYNCNSDPLVPPPLEPLPGIAVYSQGGLVFNGTTALTLLQDVGGIYTIIPGKLNDTLYDRQPGQTTIDVKIPDPIWKSGYLGG